MNKTLNFYGKDMALQLSDNAQRQAQQLEQRLIIEVQVYFSCLLAKRLAFYSDQPLDGAYQIEPQQFEKLWQRAHPLNDKLAIAYSTIMTQSCAITEDTTTPPVTDFEIENQKPYVPAWLKLDYNDAIWSGEFGWKASVKGYSNTKQVRQAIAAG